jgi:hypothetical protein
VVVVVVVVVVGGRRGQAAIVAQLLARPCTHVQRAARRQQAGPQAGMQPGCPWRPPLAPSPAGACCTPHTPGLLTSGRKMVDTTLSTAMDWLLV